MGARTTSELLEACRAGDDRAWRSFVEQYGALILSIPRRYGLGAADCDEVFGEVFLRVVRAIDRVEKPAALPKWLIQITTRVTWGVARRRSIQLSAEFPEPVGGDAPDEVVAALEREQLLREAIAKLPAKGRELLTLLYFARPPLSYDEIARRLKIPRGSIGPTRARYLEKLRALLDSRLRSDVSGEAPDGL